MSTPPDPTGSPRPSPSLGAVREPSGVNVLAELWPFVAPYRWPLLATLLFMTLAAVGILLGPVAMGKLVDQGMVSADPARQIMALRGHFLALFAIGAAVGVFSAARYYCVGWLGERVTADLRTQVYRNVLRQSPQFFETTKTGEILSRLNADTTLVQTVVGASLSNGLRSAVVVLGSCLALVLTSPRIMIEVLGLVLFVLLPAMGVDRYVLRLARASRERLAEAGSIAVEVFNAVPVVQSFNQEAREVERFAGASETAFEAGRRYLRVRAPLMAFSMSAIAASLLWGLFQGTQQVQHGDMTVGQLSQTVVYIVMLLSSMAVLVEVWGEMQRASSAMQRLLELLHAQPHIASVHGARAAPSASEGAEVVFDNVNFAYPSRLETAALSGFSLRIAPGQTVALVGPSGAGKTTLFQLLLRFFEAGSGCISMDGVPLKDLDLHALRARIGVVPQDSTIFSGSLWDNIRYGRPDADPEEVMAAARAAHVDEFVSRLAQRYDTQVGERGLRLSGGQRQRIAIARAILKNAPLLLLDEATSALDAQSERVVQDALNAAMRGRTTLVIAHRLSTVTGADRIVVMERGRLVDSGTHQELLARCALYAKLASMQFDAAASL